MIVYLQPCRTFLEDVDSNRIKEIIHEEFKRLTGRSVGHSELESWRNSLQYMDRIVRDPSIPVDAGVAIEFNIPNTGKRVDFIITGYNETNKLSAVIIELKQWETVTATPKDAIVSTFVGGAVREVSHPSYQAWSYATLLQDFNEAVEKEPILLNPCAYLHNCSQEETVRNEIYRAHLNKAPSFLQPDAERLRDFIRRHIKKGDSCETMYRLQDGRIRPSRGLADHLSSLLKGNKDFTLIDDQKVVYETALAAAEDAADGKKRVVLVKGGPGTGKSVVAVNLLVELTNRDQLVRYVTKNAAPRAVYESKLAGSMTKSRISSLFVGSGGFAKVLDEPFHTLIVDEAHRLNEKSGLYSNQGENQIKEIIQNSQCAVFFLDEDQRIHWKDIGSRAEILHWAKEARADVTELQLASQFRCAGSDGYLAWLDNVLQVRETANWDLDRSAFDFRVCGSATELRDLIYEKNEESNKARLVAGYCWDWISKKDGKGMDIVLDDGKFQAQWNLSKDGSTWIIAPDSVKEVGCIHTCQGLEVDYIGVIIGPDMIARNGMIVTDGTARSNQDSSIKGFKSELKTNPKDAREKADMIIKNTYRTLMSRGMKGCYVYCTDRELSQYLQDHLVEKVPTQSK
jgi:uncharacterized protein